MGGGCKILCVCNAYHDPLKDSGSSRVLDALSCYLSFILKHSDTKWQKKRKRTSIFFFFFFFYYYYFFFFFFFFLGGGGCMSASPPSGSATTQAGLYADQ